MYRSQVTHWTLSTQYFSVCFFPHLHLIKTLKPDSVSDCCGLAGGETEGSGPVSDVSFPNEEQRVDADPNQQLHIPESVLWWDRVHHLHQHQRQVGSSYIHTLNLHLYTPWSVYFYWSWIFKYHHQFWFTVVEYKHIKTHWLCYHTK